MFGLHSSLLVLCATLVAVSSADLISTLTQYKINFLAPGQEGYSNSSQAFNLRFAFSPAVITFPKCAQDVSIIVQTAQKFGYSAVARSGGHSYIANCLGGKDGSVVIDMSNFKQVSVDPETFTATIGSGNRLGDVALSLNDVGRAIPHGTCPYVGIGGHSGHGGYGFTSRKWGLLLDTILSLEVVLANGTIANVSQDCYPDLFWALRGASSSMGVVTSIQVETFAAPPSATVFKYHWELNAADAASATQEFQNFVQTDIPQEMAAEIVLSKGSSKGRVNFGLIGGWYAPADQFHSFIAPLLKNLPPYSEKTITAGTYIKSVENLGGLGRLNSTGVPDTHDTFYAKSIMTPEKAPMSIEALNAFMSYLGEEGFAAETDWFVQFELYGGTNSAINNVAPDATAFANRDSMLTIQFYTSSGNTAFPDSGITLLDGMESSIIDNEPADWDYRAYPNYIDNLLEDWQTLYYGSHYKQLQDLKDQYDPNNLFNFPESIDE